MDMYQQISPEMPGQLYAELVRTRAQERLAQRTATQCGTAPSAVLRTARRFVASVPFGDAFKITTARHT
jgi:hypothetical protein